MAQCEFCSKKVAQHIDGYECPECGRLYCGIHCLPENHGCTRKKVEMKTASDYETLDKIRWKPSADEFPYHLYPPPFFAIEPPVKCEVGETIELPKQLFPFTEDTLKFELYRKLEKMGVEACLDPKISAERGELTISETLKLWSGEKKYVKNTAPKMPDILIANFMQIWEVKSGLTDFELQQAIDYSYITGMSAYTMAWKCSHLHERVEYNLALIDPITGAVKAPSRFFSHDILSPFNYGLELKPNLHTEMQYVLFKKLRENGCEVTAEIDYGPNIVFAPDEITVNEVNGITDWKPKTFSAGPLERIGRERFPEAIGDLWGKIDIVAKPKDDCVVDGYEIKPGLNDLKQGQDMVKQLLNMVRSRILDRVWIVVPSWLASEIEKTIANDDLLRRVGVIARWGENTFETVREAEKLAADKNHVVKLKVCE